MNCFSMCLSNSFQQGERCQRCDSYLQNSTYKGELVVLSVSKSLTRGFMCINCITFPKNSHRNYYRSDAKIKKFLKQQKKKEVKV
jgi:hypothetical protein